MFKKKCKTPKKGKLRKSKVIHHDLRRWTYENGRMIEVTSQGLQQFRRRNDLRPDDTERSEETNEFPDIFT